MPRVDFGFSRYYGTATDWRVMQQKIQRFFIRVVHDIQGSDLTVMGNEIGVCAAFTALGYPFHVTVVIENNRMRVTGEVPFHQASFIEQFTVMLS